jgi:O-antigen/teichoic acid export membrane protein
MRLERSSLGFLWRYGIRIQVTLISGLVNRSIDRLWLGAIQSPTAVTVYDVADRAAYSFVYLAHPVTNALTPRFAALSVDAAQGREWCRLYRTSTQVTALFAGSLAALVFVCAPWLLRSWLGVIHPDSLYSLRVLALGYGVLVSFAPASVAARAQSVPRLAARLAVGFTVVNVLASLGGVLVAGVRGAATASAACGVLYGLAYPLFVEGRILDTRLGTGLRMALPAWLPSMLAGAAVWIGLLTIPGSAHASSRLNALAVLVVAGCVFVFVLFLSASVTRTLPKPLVDRAIMLARSARGRIRRRGTKPDNRSSSNDSESV